MKKDIGNQLPCLKEVMWKRVCEGWYSVALNVLEELNNSMPRRIADLMNYANRGATNTDYDVSIQVFSCVFNGMHLSMLLYFHWNVFNIHIQMLSDYTLI